MPQAFDLLADLLANPRFDEDDLVQEQKVIIEEMKMIEDTPDELLTELFHAAYFPDHSLGRPIEGTEETVSSFDRDTIAEFHAHNYCAAQPGDRRRRQCRARANGRTGLAKRLPVRQWRTV